MKSECVVVSNGGSLFLVGPTDQMYRMSLWERIVMAFTNRYPQRGLDAIYAGIEPEPKTLTPTTMLNMFVDQLNCIANPPPARGDVFLYAYMPGATRYQEALAAAKEGKPDHWIAAAHWCPNNEGESFAPTPFVFVARSCDPTFKDKTGLDGGYLYPSMRLLVNQFAGMCSRCTENIALKHLIIERTSE